MIACIDFLQEVADLGLSVCLSIRLDTFKEVIHSLCIKLLLDSILGLNLAKSRLNCVYLTEISCLLRSRLTSDCLKVTKLILDR